MQQRPARQPVQSGPDGAPSCDPPAPDTSDLPLISDPCTEHQQDPQRTPAPERKTLTPLPAMHFPHCRLEITAFPESDLPASLGAAGGKFEQVALPGHLVRTLVSRLEDADEDSDNNNAHDPQSHLLQLAPPPHRPDSQPAAQSRPTGVRIRRHFDDEDDWVYSRCILADFTGFREDQAEALSSQGRLCCWANVVLQPAPQQPARRTSSSSSAAAAAATAAATATATSASRGGAEWELEFVVQRVGVRDPRSGWCECF